MDAEKIAELRRLEAAATPGPWIANAYGRGGVHVYDPERHAKKQPGEGPALWHDQVFDFANSRHDEILTAAARNALPALLALAERAAELERRVASEEDGTAVDEAWLRQIGFVDMVLQDETVLVLRFTVMADPQWIESGPASFSHGLFNLRRWSESSEEDDVPPDIVEVQAKTRGQLRTLCRALGIPLQDTAPIPDPLAAVPVLET